MKRLVRIAAAVLGALVLVAIAATFLVDANAFRPALEAQLGNALGRPVKLGDLRLRLFSGAVRADNLSIAKDAVFGEGAFLEARSVQLGVELMPLIFSRKLNVTRLVIDEPRISLVQSPSGDWNFSTLGRAAKPKPATPPAESGTSLDLSVKLVKIVDGQVSLTRGRSRLEFENVNLELRDFSATSHFPFSLRAGKQGGGEIRIDGAAGPLPERDASRIPFEGTLAFDKLNMGGSGIVSLEGKASSDGATARFTGQARAERFKLAEHGTPAGKRVEFDLAADHNLAEGSGNLTKGDLRIGGASARVGGSYSTSGAATVLHMTLAGSSMPVPELATLLPALGLTLPSGSSLQGGLATVKLEVDGPVNRLVTTGVLRVVDTTLGGFDLGRKLAVIQALAGVKADPTTRIETFAGAVRMSHEGTVADNLQLIVPSIGEMTGAGSISPSSAVDFRMTAKVSGQSIPFLVQGTTSDPAFRPDVNSIVKEKAAGVAEGLLKGLFNRKKN